MMTIVYKKWHDLLGMPRKDHTWHVNDIADEYAELKEARGPINRWSEYADVAYTVTRGRWDGYTMTSPISKLLFAYGSIYMLPKYSLRYVFFRNAGKKLGATRPLCEVRNPKKIHKLHHIADKYGLDSAVFAEQCQKQLRYWPLLK